MNQSAAAMKASSRCGLRLSRLITVTAYVYAGITLLLLIMYRMAVDIWPVRLWATVLPFSLLSAMISALILALRKQWAGFAILLILAGAFAGFYGRYFVPRPVMESTQNEQHVFSVFTLNLGSDIANASPERMIEVIQESHADILAFQEVNEAHAQTFQETLLGDYPFQIIYAAGEGTLGIALLSRYPIVAEGAFYGELGFLPYIEAVIDMHGTKMKVLNVHPAPPEFTPNPRQLFRSRGVHDAEMFAARAAQGPPTLLLGDLNATDQSKEYQILADSVLQDAFYERGRGFGFTYPVNRPYGYTRIPSVPLFRLDYIWHTGHFETISVWQGGNAGSDHLPLIARLSLTIH